MTDITVPTLGESVSEATVGAWQVKEGDTVKKDDVLVELETDKVSVEVRAEEDGVLASISAQEGDTVEIGAKLGELGEGSGEASKKDAKPAKSGTKAEAKSEPKSDAKSDAKSSGGSSGGDIIEARVPVMGESVAEGQIGSFLVQAGDRVEQDQALMEIETDKVAVEVPCPAAGVVEEFTVAEGDTVTPDQVVAKIRAGASAGGSGGGSKQSGGDSAPKPGGGSSDAKAMPSAKRVAAENNLDLAKVEGSGKDGRVTKGDALKALEGGGRPAAPAPGAPASGAPSKSRETGEREERVKMTRLRQTIARRLKEAQSTAAMLTTYNEADMSAIMALRKEIQEDFVAKHGVKLGFMSFFVKACVTALKELPAVNAEIDGTDIIYKNYYDMGVAVGTDRGLVVPVVRDADQMSLAEIEKTIIDLGKRARDGKLGIDEMQGATFTLSNGGVYGSLLSSPILNAPQSGILGMHKIQDRPVALNGEVKIRPMMYLALSYDHRIVDGKEAVTFLVRVKESLENTQRMLLDI
jgi:2-oxoglutarate dehydrogenase E2 component (dihydrolipoamide succinyltransferase)